MTLIELSPLTGLSLNGWSFLPFYEAPVSRANVLRVFPKVNGTAIQNMQRLKYFSFRVIVLYFQNFDVVYVWHMTSFVVMVYYCSRAFQFTVLIKSFYVFHMFLSTSPRFSIFIVLRIKYGTALNSKILVIVINI